MDVQGDSPLLRSHGAVLRSAGENVAVIADGLDRRVETMHFRGTAADRFRAQMSERTARLRRVSQELGDLAETVTHGGGFQAGI
jgi:hypothetical protein